MKPFVVQKSITNRSSDVLVRYFADIDKIPLLSADEEYELAMKVYNDKDKKSLDKLIESNLRFVVSVAKQYANDKISLNDLINEGNHGLITAANKFDPTRGFKFISYAVSWIRRDIMEYLNRNVRSIRLPANKIALLKPMNAIIDSKEQDFGRKLSDTEIIELLIENEFNIREVNFYLDLRFTNTVSLDKQIDENTSSSLSDLLTGDTLPEADYIIKEEERSHLTDILVKLLDNPKELEVITLHYGIGNTRDMTLKEIAEKMKLSRERVRQIRDRALGRLKKKSDKFNLSYMFNG